MYNTHKRAILYVLYGLMLGVWGHLNTPWGKQCTLAINAHHCRHHNTRPGRHTSKTFTTMHHHLTLSPLCHAHMQPPPPPPPPIIICFSLLLELPPQTLTRRTLFLSLKLRCSWNTGRPSTRVKMKIMSCLRCSLRHWSTARPSASTTAKKPFRSA